MSAFCVLTSCFIRQVYIQAFKLPLTLGGSAGQTGFWAAWFKGAMGGPTECQVVRLSVTRQAGNRLAATQIHTG